MSSDMKSRFTRAHNTLVRAYITMSPDERDAIRLDQVQFCTRWLRNESNLWEDYEEDSAWIIDGCACDPNHPDNLSDMVVKNFINLLEIGITDFEEVECV